MRRYQASSSPLLYKSLSIFIAFFIGYAVYSRQETTSASLALSKGFELLEKGEELEKTKAHFETAAEEPLIAHWAHLGQGRLALRENRLEAAETNFNLVEANSAASLDAKLGLLQLDMRKGPQESAETGSAAIGPVGAKLNQLEQELRQARRRDLLPKLALLKASLAERSKNYPYARSLLREIRLLYPRSAESKMARLAESKILREQNISLTLAEILQEASTLLREGQLDDALGHVQNAKTQIGPDTPAALEAMSLEEKIVRKSGRNEEADRLLAIISADGEVGSGDKALLQMSKNAWNAEEPERALSFLGNFEKRFRSSDLLWEARYIRARILDEEGQASEAKSVYQSIDSKSAPVLQREKALRRIAWGYMRTSDYEHAAKTFASIATLTKDKGVSPEPELTAEEPRSKSTSSARKVDMELREAHFHARYWHAFALSKLSPEERSELSGAQTPEAILSAVQEEDPFGYYGMLARETAGDAVPPGASESSADCFLATPEEMHKRIAILRGHNLQSFAKHEVNWWTPRENSSSVDIKKELTRAKLFQEAELSALSIGSLRLLFRKLYVQWQTTPDNSLLETCAAELNQLRYPLPFREEFIAASKEENAPLEFTLAIARTESHFDPKAQSNKDAIGLMQLLRSTAKQEGLLETEELFEPKVNIRLGSKHLARLLKRFNGNTHYVSAAYNGGSSAVERWLKRYPDLSSAEWTELIGYPETKNYVKKVRLAKAGYAAMKASTHPSEPGEKP